MTPLISLKNLSKIYGENPNQFLALKSVSLEIKKGQFVAIIGPSGSGKSTLMNILGCLDKPTSGSYNFDGKSVFGLSANQLAKIRNRKIGFVFQSFNLLPRTTAQKNVELPLIYAGYSSYQRKQKATQTLEKVGLGDKTSSTPAHLSGGEQQRVAIARALVNSPSIIFADEPTGNLDTKSAGEIMTIFTNLNKEGKTIVLITHEMDIAKKAHRIITIRDGQIVKDSNIKKNRSHGFN